MFIRFMISIGMFSVLFACSQGGQKWTEADARDTTISAIPDTPAVRPSLVSSSTINTGTTDRLAVVNFAKTLVHVPYKYASIDPAVGFDCSGFITYVFNHFNIAVPRSSVDFTNVGTVIDPGQSMPGDLILFTGTDSTIRVVGHMGIITENNGGQLKFIHSTSGKQDGVTITPLENYYRSRFVKVIRIFPA